MRTGTRAPADPMTAPSPPEAATTDAGRRAAVVRAGHRGDAVAAARGLDDDDDGVRAAALGALARCGRMDPGLLRAGLADPSPAVRRRACDLAGTPGPGGRPPGDDVVADLGRALGDPDPLVVESACWALGERAAPAAVPALADVAARHADARCREAAVAALGAVGDRAGLPAVLGALDDRPTVRRRATVALAAFDGQEVDDALQRSAADRDWQVREVAEILLGIGDGADGPGTPEPAGPGPGGAEPAPREPDPR